ncbi:MAG: inosine/xanthosine triphosphatase [Archaeoglobaceae archaeon]
MKVIVGSLNPTKIEGTRQAFSPYFEDLYVEGKDVDSGSPDQPFDKDTIKGAFNRAVNAHSDGDLGVGIEAGLFWFEGIGHMDFQVAVIYDGQNASYGFGPGFAFPPEVIEKALKGTEVGDSMEQLTGIEDIGEKYGAIHYLTGGKVSRDELSRLAVTMALIPRINPENYDL